MNISEYESFTFTHEGNDFQAMLYADEYQDTPWDRECGHGPVTDWERRDKLPGEMILYSNRHGFKRFYDFQETVKIAKRDGWDTKPYGQGTAGERANRAALADFKRLRAWCNQDWFYCGVVVNLIDDEGEPIGESESLWGIESDCEDYIREVANELASEVVTQFELA